MKKAMIKATGETVAVYKLHSGNWYDYDNMGVGSPAKSKLGKKEFKESELDFNVVQ